MAAAAAAAAAAANEPPTTRRLSRPKRDGPVQAGLLELLRQRRDGGGEAAFPSEGSEGDQNQEDFDAGLSDAGSCGAFTADEEDDDDDWIVSDDERHVREVSTAGCAAFIYSTGFGAS